MNKANKIKNLIKNEVVLEALDILDLDEAIIDEKLDVLMKKPVLQNNHLKTISTFLKYKYMICLQEETDCDNEIYLDFAIKLLLQKSFENTDILLEVLTTALLLNSEKLQGVVEHFLQQLMTIDDCNSLINLEITPDPFKVINRVLELCIENKVTVHYSFLINEIENMIANQEKLLATQFFTKTVPLLIDCCQNYTVLNLIWDRILSRFSALTKNDFVILCTLSEYYLPLSTDRTFGKVESTIIEVFEFWKMLHFGFLHEDYSIRKCSIYLATRAIHCAGVRPIAVRILDDEVPIFYWNKDEKKSIESAWFALFTLLETLEEKQSHLVLSALKLFDNISLLHRMWYSCALVRAFTHDANSVLQSAIEIALRNDDDNLSSDKFPFHQLIVALDNTFLYENIFDYDKNDLMPSLIKFLEYGQNTKNIIQTLPRVNLSPIPKFYISYALMLSKSKNTIALKTVMNGFFGSNTPILNNAMIQCATECCFINFVMSHAIENLTDQSMMELFSSISTKKLLLRDNVFWNRIVDFVNKYNGEEFQNMMDKSYLKNITDFKSFTCVLLVRCDFTENNVNSLVDYVKFIMMCLKESQNREYSSVVEFDKYFFLLTSFIELMDDTQDEDIVKGRIFKQVFAPFFDVLVNYLKTRLRSTGQSDELEHISKYIVAFEKLVVFCCRRENHSNLTSLPFNSLVDMAECLIKTDNVNLLQKYFSVKILSIAVTYISQTGHYDKTSKLERIESYQSLIQNTSFSQNEVSETSKGKIVSELNKAKLQVYIIYYSLLEEQTSVCINKMYEEVIDLLETGGHGCLLLIIQLTEILLPNLLMEGQIDKITFVVDRIWRESFELRKNEQFRICFKAFTKMLYQRKLMESKDLYSTLLDYGDQIFELGEQAPFVIQEFIEHMATVSKDLHFPYSKFLDNALSFGMSLRRDQRIEFDCCDYISKQLEYFIIPDEVKYTVNPATHIRWAALEIFKNQDVNVHSHITSELRKKTDILTKPTNRYHGNSLQHRFLLRTLQCLIYSFKYQPDGNHVDENLSWCIQRLIKQPHHISSRIFLEWYIALYVIHKNLRLNLRLIADLKLSEIPQISLFVIMYHVLKHQIILSKNTGNQYSDELCKNFQFVIQMYLPHTMGQIFNTRLHAQYFTLRLNEMMNYHPVNNDYKIICKTIQDTFDLSSNEKNLVKIKNDIYLNDFDVINELDIDNIFLNIPRDTGVVQDEFVYSPLSNEVEFKSKTSIKNSSSSQEFKRKVESEFLEYSRYHKRKILSSAPQTPEKNLNIQKKFVPWKNMLADLGISENKMVNISGSNLIVVASLIDRAPNLGGLARTCEVFGVKEYVIDNLKHLEDKQFQTLSVSSERWINSIIEISPGINLKNYLIDMRRQGYTIVGAEQTSSSITLNSFVFPSHTLLLLGHEKEGIPCDLLNFLDYCVEIPQHGLVRSLNVHVTASIFIWEYTRQQPY